MSISELLIPQYVLSFTPSEIGMCIFCKSCLYDGSFWIWKNSVCFGDERAHREVWEFQKLFLICVQSLYCKQMLSEILTQIDYILDSPFINYLWVILHGEAFELNLKCKTLIVKST